jgi:hypothetical protein
MLSDYYTTGWFYDHVKNDISALPVLYKSKNFTLRKRFYI